MRNASAMAIVVCLCATVGTAQVNLPKPKAPSTNDLKDLAKKTELDKVFDNFIDDFLKDPSKGWKKLKDWSPLSPDDQPLDPNYNPPGSPELPTNCLESSACAQCFPAANDRLKRVLVRLEKLRRVYAWTKAYKERGIAFGDSVASIHTIGGLAWITERMKIEKSYKQFESSYDAKYAELVEELKGALQQIAACEESVYGERDWYNRFGFIYYQFMADRYRR